MAQGRSQEARSNTRDEKPLGLRSLSRHLSAPGDAKQQRSRRGQHNGYAQARSQHCGLGPVEHKRPCHKKRHHGHAQHHGHEHGHGDGDATLAAEGRSVVLVTHYPEDIIPAIERVLLIGDARVMADGPKNELLSSERMSELFGVPLAVEERDGWYGLRGVYR